MDLTYRLDEVKAALRITHDSDDDLLRRLIRAATDEYLSFTGIEPASEYQSGDELPEADWQGIIVMVSAGYDAQPDAAQMYRDRAEALWMPSRENLGV